MKQADAYVQRKSCCRLYAGVQNTGVIFAKTFSYLPFPLQKRLQYIIDANK